jgi:8-oxo-dGTP diphosphatase
MTETYTPASEEERAFLAEYDASKYPIITSTVDLALFAGSETQGVFFVLLIQRGNYPYKNCWALPGGFINSDETLKDAARREAEEETGVKVNHVEFLFVADKPDRDPRGRCLSSVFTAKFDKPVKATGMDDAADAQWFPVDFALDLPLAFDHKDILLKAAKHWGILTRRTWDDSEVMGPADV